MFICGHHYVSCVPRACTRELLRFSTNQLGVVLEGTSRECEVRSVAKALVKLVEVFTKVRNLTSWGPSEPDEHHLSLTHTPTVLAVGLVKESEIVALVY